MKITEYLRNAHKLILHPKIVKYTYNAILTFIIIGLNGHYYSLFLV